MMSQRRQGGNRNLSLWPVSSAGEMAARTRSASLGA
jgi:hypothetical protein